VFHGLLNVLEVPEGDIARMRRMRSEKRFDGQVTRMAAGFDRDRGQSIPHPRLAGNGHTDDLQKNGRLMREKGA
jgi:hypothetical protein